MNWKSLDWKYLVMFVVTLGGSLIPIYMGQSDQAARSITVKRLASTSLQPVRHAGNQELEVMLDGRKIDDPYFSLLKVMNTGSKPIVSSDFETPLELVVTGDTTIVSAQVTKSTPPDITTKVSIDDKRVMIAPYLSNPEDALFLTVITSGGQPGFEPRARIAGVKSIPFVEVSVPKPSKTSFAIKLVSAFAMISLYFLYMANASNSLIITRPMAYATGMSLILGCTFTLTGMPDQIADVLTSNLATIIGLVAFMICGALVAFLLHRKMKWH